MGNKKKGGKAGEKKVGGEKRWRKKVGKKKLKKKVRREKWKLGFLAKANSENLGFERHFYLIVLIN